VRRRSWRSGDSTSHRVLDVLEFFYLRLWKIIVQWVSVVKFSINDRSGDGTDSFEVKIRTKTANFTNMIISRLLFIQRKWAVRQRKKTSLRAEWVVISELVLILASCCGRPIRRNLILEELNVNRLAVIQEDICWKECWNWVLLESKTDG